MRKLLSITLLCCLLIYIGGYHLLFAVRQYGLKEEMRDYLKQHADARFGSRFNFHLQNGEIADVGFSWEDESHEFRYNNELYDVIAIACQGNALSITALKDDNENDLEQQVKQIRQTQHGSPLTGISQFKFSPVICECIDEFPVGVDIVVTPPSPFYKTIFSSLFDEIQTPPPRC